MRTAMKKIRTQEVYTRLADWIVQDSGPAGSRDVVLSYELIARRFKSLRDSSDHPKANHPVREEELRRALSYVRYELETRYKNTLYNVRGKGYKLCTPEELALYTAKFYRRTILYANRTYRLAEIVDRRYIPAALRTVFCDTEGNVKQLSIKGRKFLTMFGAYLKSNEAKELEHKKE